MAHLAAVGYVLRGSNGQIAIYKQLLSMGAQGYVFPWKLVRKKVQSVLPCHSARKEQVLWVLFLRSVSKRDLWQSMRQSWSGGEGRGEPVVEVKPPRDVLGSSDLVLTARLQQCQIKGLGRLC